MSGLREYLKAKGAETLTVENCPALAEYDRAMREEVIPAIERDLKAQRRAAHFLRLGIPDPNAPKPYQEGSVMDEQTRLDEFDRDEFRDATRKLWPAGYTEQDFERDWTEFQAEKRKRAMQ